MVSLGIAAPPFPIERPVSGSASKFRTDKCLAPLAKSGANRRRAAAISGPAKRIVEFEQMKGAIGLLDFLLASQGRGQETVLVTLTDVTGSSSRAPGTHMAVAADGSSCGSFSGGCIEAAVVAEALDVLRAGKPRSVQFGAGSPYIDIRLPCGGGIALLFTPRPNAHELSRASDWLSDRQPVALTLSLDDELVARLATDEDVTGWRNSTFVVRHDPDLHIHILGHGEEPLALAQVALAYGAGISIYSADEDLLDRLKQLPVESFRLHTTSRTAPLGADPYSAIVFLFHDHDWETELIAQSLATPAFFIGAMGSRRTHAARLARLGEAGVPDDLAARLVAPIGLIHATRDPATLALSILSHIVAMALDTARRR